MTGDMKMIDVVIVGGSYAGLSAAMALGRSLNEVLIIDSGRPCNRQTPFAHNLVMHDGQKPADIANAAKEQVTKYPTVNFMNDTVTAAEQVQGGFEVRTAQGEVIKARKLLFTTGVADIMPPMKGFAECWGISVLHCPYCHGYEVKNEEIGLLGNGNLGFELCKMLGNWSKSLTLFTNGQSTLTEEQVGKLQSRNVQIVEEEIDELIHNEGLLQQVVLKNGNRVPLAAIFARPDFRQHCTVPEQLGCVMTEEGYIKIDDLHKTTVDGVFAAGDNCSMLRSLAMAIAAGSKTGACISKELIAESF